MKPGTLLRLYPRAWRERYGEEFLAALDDRPLHWQQVVDIISAAIDARLSADVRAATAESRSRADGGGMMTLKSLMACDRSQARFTTRDSLVGAGVMVAFSALLGTLGVFARRGGAPLAGDALAQMAFPVSLTLSMPFWLMKGQPWKAQAVVIGTTLVLLAGIAWVASAF